MERSLVFFTLHPSIQVYPYETGRLRATAGARLPRVKGECIGASYIYAIDPTNIVRTQESTRSLDAYLRATVLVTAYGIQISCERTNVETIVSRVDALARGPVSFREPETISVNEGVSAELT